MFKRYRQFTAQYIYLLVSCYYLFTVGILSGKHRQLIRDLANHLGFPSEQRFSIPHKQGAQLVLNDACCLLCKLDAVNGDVVLNELIFIVQLVLFRKPGKIFEIGTFNGRTTLNIAANSPNNAIVYTLDLPRDGMTATKYSIDQFDEEFIDKEISGSDYIGTEWEPKIRQLYGDSATFDFKPYYNEMDLVFIDGAHSHEYVLSDSLNAIKMLHDGKGVILWHDYGGAWTGVTNAINELQTTNQLFSGLFRIEGTALACLVCD